MGVSYEIIYGTHEEEHLINEIISFISNRYADKISIDALSEIEIVDKLENNSSGRFIKNKILLPRKYGLEGIQYNERIEDITQVDTDLRMLISTIYHELWHVSTWHKYENMYEYILDEKNKDLYIAFAYMYWIEYIAHTETVFMEAPKVMREFCNNFVSKKWNKIEYGYSYFIKSLPYYLVRSQYLGIYDELTPKIESKKLREAVYEFEKTSRQLLNNGNIDDIQKADIIKEKIRRLFD